MVNIITLKYFIWF